MPDETNDENTVTKSVLASDFFKINIGHVFLAVVFIFGLGGAWFSVGARQDQTDLKVSAFADAASAQVKALGDKESAQILSVFNAAIAADLVISQRFDLKADNNAARITKMETQSLEEGKLATSVAVLSTEVKNLQDTCQDLKGELRSFKEVNPSVK